MQPSFVRRLGFCIHKTNIGAQRIDGNRLEIFVIIIAFLSIDNKNGKFCFFEKTFLLANISMNVALGIFFLTVNNVKVNFTD